MSFATRAANGAEPAPQRNGGSVAQGHSSSPLNNDWVLVSYKEPSFSDVESLDCEGADFVGGNKDQDAHSDVSDSPEICKGPVSDTSHEIVLLLEQYGLSRKHYQDCHSAVTKNIQSEIERADSLLQTDQAPSSGFDNAVRQTSRTATATCNQSDALEDCDRELCELEQRLNEKISVLIERSGETMIQHDYDVPGVETTNDDANASPEAFPLLENYFEKAGDVFVANERLMKLQEECEDVLAGSKPYPGLDQSVVPTAQDLHLMYEGRRRGLVERLADAEKHLMECREACVRQGINPESARYRRISGTVNGRAATSEEADSGYETSRNES